MHTSHRNYDAIDFCDVGRGDYLARQLLTPNVVRLSGFTAGRFQGFDSITEMECSGGSLASDVDVLSLVIYDVHDDHVVASANVGKKECSTSGSFSSCVFDPRDSRRTKLRALVTDRWGEKEEEEEWRVYGCNVTVFRTGGRVRTVTWMLRVERRSKSPLIKMDVIRLPGLVSPLGACFRKFARRFRQRSARTSQNDEARKI